MIEGIILDEDSADESDDEDLTIIPQVCICVRAFICMHLHFFKSLCMSVSLFVCKQRRSLWLLRKLGYISGT